MEFTANWKHAAGNTVGLLSIGPVENTAASPALEVYGQKLGQELRSSLGALDRPQLRELPALAAYHRFYKQFRKSYHVQLQLESVVLENKPIRSPSALVQAMFLAELKSHLLTSGHDLDLVQLPLTIGVAEGSERYLRINNQPQELKPGDLYICDRQEILSSVIYGPDYRTRITNNTCRVLYTVYGVAGISAASIKQHLGDLRDRVLLVSPAAQVEQLEVFQSAGG